MPNRIRWPALAACLLIAFPSGGARAEPGWIAFEPPDASFRVEMPGEPALETRERWFPLSRFVSRVYKTRRGGDVFGVNHTDIPGAILFVTPDKAILDATRKGFLKSSEARELSFAPAEVDGRPAWKLRYAIPARGPMPAQAGTARMLFVAKRLFIFYTELAAGSSEAESRRYFESIRIPAP
ncbi:MAG: hypothetical protein NZ990_12540 [Myxococcota bacterium]|nr:hypothetical protein [Myxococcota bacterium]